MTLALQEIRARPGQHILLALVLTLLVTASLGMISLYRGIVVDATAVINLAKPDLWVVERGTIGPFAERSILDASIADGVAGVPGIARTRRYLQVIRELPMGGTRRRTSIIGIDPRSDDGNWLPIADGRPPRDRGDVAVDRSFGMALGQTLTIDNQRYLVVGTMNGFVDTEGDPILVSGIADARLLAKPVIAAVSRQRVKTVAESLEATPYGRQLSDSAEQSAVVRTTLFSAPEVPISAVMVDVAQTARSADVARLIEQRQDVSVLTQSDQIDSIVNHRMYKLRIQIMIFCIFILVITGIITGLIVYARVLENRSIIALLLYMGAPQKNIAGYVIFTALILAMEAYVLASATGFFLFKIFPRQTVLLPLDRLVVGVAVLGISLVSSLYAVRVALRTSPREALE